ncbi:L,D-transpeptidase family protein [Flaviflagellibacter deserti]|uniref:L,D-transpeptidase family protein n=1 Tax=Flaviflagellibacter deserti TaxID=2267266 RepID=A0ABV9YYS6_9HYPH
MRASSGIGFLAAVLLATTALAQETAPIAPATPGAEAAASTPSPEASPTSPPPAVANRPADETQQSQPALQSTAPAEPATPPVAPVEQAQEPQQPAAPVVAAEPPAPVETIEGVIAKKLAEAKEDPEVVAFYAQRNNAPLWIADGHLSEKAKAVMARIARADEEGLDAAAFVLPDANATDTSLARLAAAEITLSHAAVAYARQAQGGRLIPKSLSPLITAEPQRPTPASVLNTLAANDGAADWLESYNPPHAGFKALKTKLAELRAKAVEPSAAPPPEVPGGAVLKPGMVDDRVPLLRTRLGLPAGMDNVFDPALVEAVKAFQRKNGLKPTGSVGKASTQALNRRDTPADPTSTILVNMERWRWLPRDLGQTHIMVNIPEYMARIVRDGQVAHETRVVVGKPQNQTPVFSDEMEFIIVNPSWNVPYSIASKEMLPNLQRDPTYLARQGMEVLDVSGKRPVVIDSTMVDWYSVNMKRIRIRQPPGERNALGHIKFMFPNQHAVYLHDTPSRNLFANAVRAYSHGCVRVQDPFALADVLLEGTDWNAARMKKLIGGSERRIDLAHKLPVHLTYFTADIGPDGNLVTRNDIYGHDRKMRAALGLGGQIQASAKTN